MKKIGLCFFILIMSACGSSFKDSLNSRELVSSKGEKIYINTLNWGVTNDRQLTLISSNKSGLQTRNDTVQVVRGLEPFIYSFKNDTLKLFFYDSIGYTINESFKTITVRYIALDRDKFREIQKRSYGNSDYYAVPMRTQKKIPNDMPIPSSK